MQERMKGNLVIINKLRLESVLCLVEEEKNHLKGF